MSNVVDIPVKYTPEKATQILVLLREGWTDERLAREGVVSRATISKWRKEHPEFAQASRDAKQAAIDRKARSARGNRGPNAVRDENVDAALCDALREGASRTAAAAAAGLHPDTLHRWIEQDPEFELLLLKAEQSCQREALDRLREAGPAEWQKWAWLLERRYGDTFARKTEVSHTERVRTATKIGSELADAVIQSLAEAGLDAETQERLRKTLAERVESVAQAG